MKISEITSNKSGQIDNILTVLSMTDDDSVFSFVEKQLSSLQAKETVMSKDTRLKAIQIALQNQTDDTVIDFIESRLKQVEIEKRIESVWSARGFNKGRMSKYKDAFKSLIMQSAGSLKSKIQLLYYIKNNKVFISGAQFEKTFSATIDHIVPDAIRQNAAFQAIKNTIFFNDSFRGKGIGPAEFALALLGEKGQIVDHAGDVTIGGIGVEIKDGGGGSIKTGSPNQFRKADQLRDWIGKQVGVSLDRENKLYWDKPSDFSQAFNSLDQSKRYTLALKYVEGLYPNLDSEDQTVLAQGLSQHTGTPAVTNFFGKALLSSYQKQDEWDSILFISKNGSMTNIASPADADKINFQLAGINRDGDTQALPDGYINGRISKSASASGVARKQATTKKKQITPTSSTVNSLFTQPTTLVKDTKGINNAEDKFVAALADMANPITVAWQKIKPAFKVDAKDLALELIMSGKNDAEVARELTNDMFEGKDYE